jgi:cbb3-type cytochrome oxidase subunit 3
MKNSKSLEKFKISLTFARKMYVMKNRKLFIGIIAGIALWSCSQAPEYRSEMVVADMIAMEEMERADMNTTPPSDYVSSSAAVENPQDTTRKFIRTANLKFKVKNILQATYDIEAIAIRQGGFVTHTHLASNIDRVTTTHISADSSLLSTYYTVVNSIELRIPNVKLDTTLKEIAQNIDFLDYRTIQAEDVMLKILSNELTQKRIAKSENRVTNAIDNRGKRLNETTSAEELLLRKQEQADHARIANLSLADQINFSTINLSVYQRQSIKRELVSNDKNIVAYKQGFGSRVAEAFLQGWNILMDVVIFIVKICWLILLGILVYWLLKKYRKKSRNNTSKPATTAH